MHSNLVLFLLISVLSSNNGQRTCEMSTICGNAASIRSQMIAVRVEQERHGELLEDLSHKLDTCVSRSSVEAKLYGKSCAEPSVLTQNSEIIVVVVPQYSKHPFVVACDQLSHGGGWTIFLRRTDGSEDFYRDWNDYKNGFGRLEGEFFLGLDKLHAITSAQPQELLVLLEDNEGQRRYQVYDNFKVGSEEEGFALQSLGNSSGSAGDALATHLGQKFTTKDRDNDKHATANCAVTYSSAWWYNACHHSNLAGKYGDNTHGKGINWYQFKGHTYSLKRAQMMIRPKRLCH
ncbi:ryncolin-2-like [Drosophila ananassae]|uniref:ryncolin-2-like n=1 Tax=Drosophila ananassae TaxID=7217 RepID=UPI0013A5F015|nr:ryncolin-2-like [Drosophila ananassae]